MLRLPVDVSLKEMGWIAKLTTVSLGYRWFVSDANINV